MTRAILTAVMILALAACARPPGDFCELSQPVRPSAETLAAMSDAEVEEALAHNDYGVRACNWKP